MEETNTLHIGENFETAVSASESKSISFTIPENAPLGRHDIWISNAKGNTNRQYFVVTSPQSQAPSIDTVSPQTGGIGQQITLTGSGFTDQGNTVRTRFGIIKDVPSSNGQMLSFELQDINSQLTMSELTNRLNSSQFWPLRFTVITDHGISNAIGTYKLIKQ